MQDSVRGEQVANDLTEREREVLDLIARGRTNAEIAGQLGLSFWTAKWYVSEVISKLGVTSREEAAGRWRGVNSRSARLGRAVKSLLGVPLAARVATAAVGVTALAGGAVVIGGLAKDGIVAEVSPDETATPAVTPLVPAIPTGPTFLVASLTKGDFRRDFYVFESDRGVCFESSNTMYTPDGMNGYTRSYLPPVSGNLCHDAATPSPNAGAPGGLHLTLSPGPGAWVGAGMVAPGVTRLTATTLAGAVVEVPLISAPAGVRTDWRFFAAFLPDEDGYWNTGHIDALDAQGHVVGTQDFRPVTRNRPLVTPTP